MRISMLTPHQQKVVSGNPGLRAYLRALAVGRDATPHSWLYESEPSEATLEKWLKVLDTVKDGSEFGERVYQFDSKQLEKFGPQGAVPPIEQALETMEDQYSTGKLPVTSEIDEAVINETARLLTGNQKERLRPWSFERVVDDMRVRDTDTTNSGWPDFGRRNNPVIRSAAIQAAKSGDAYHYPAIILFRQYNKKLRPVWMFPMALNLIEGSFTQPLMDVIKRSTLSACVSPWIGFERVKTEITNQWKDGIVALGGDTTKMDANFKQYNSEIVYEIVKQLFQRQYWEELHRSISNVNAIDIVVGENAIISDQQHGIASGSGWTQLLETVFQIYLYVYQKHNAGTESVLSAMMIGDDYFGTYQKGTDESALVESWTNLYSRNGLPANPEKQDVGTRDITFLQRLFYRGWFSLEDSGTLGGIYPTIRALNSSLNPEKFHKPSQWSSDMFCIRQFMILENTVDHPLFREFVQFVARGQKDLIPFAKKSSKLLDSIATASRRVPGLNATYNQEKRDKPLSSFESIKLASKL